MSIDPSLLDDMSPDQLRHFGHEVADWVADFVANIESRPVLSRVSPGDLLAQLPDEAPLEGEPMEAILRDFEELIVPATTQWNHPGFHAYFANTGSGPGILAETLTAALNNNAMVWRTGPASTELESKTCDWLRAMLGLPAAFEGHIEDTASVSTLIALAAARHKATDGAVRESGLAGLKPLRVYCSSEAHSSVERAAMLLGIGQNGCRRVGVDDQFQMRPDLLEEAISDDLANGITPMAVVSTAGTTSTTSIDPTAAIADVCERHKLWLHVDAAYGGSMAVSEQFKHVLDGAARAQSVVVNPHKWLFVPMDCSVLFCTEMSTIREALSLVPAYLMTAEDKIARHLMDYGPALGRRFRALKLWFVLRWFGQKRIAAMIENHVDLAQEFASWVEEAEDWEVVAPHPMSTVLYRYVPKGVEREADIAALNERIMHAVNAKGRSFLSHTEVNRRPEAIYALRCAVGNARTQSRHLQALWVDLQKAAGELGSPA